MRKYMLLFALLLPWAANSQDIQKWQQKAAKGDAAAKVELALHYEYGYGVAIDIDRAYHLLQEAATAGNADAKAHLAFLHYNYLGYHAADTTILRLAQEADAAGSGYGTYTLAKCYYHGVGVEHNYAKGKQLIEKAVKRKCPEAIVSMATDLISGTYLFEADPDAALKMLKSLKDDVHTISKYDRIAYYYSTFSDFKQAWQWLNRGIALNDPESRIDSYTHLFYGNGVPCNEREAITQIEHELRNATAIGDSITIHIAKDQLARMYAIADDTTLRRYDLSLQYYLDTKQYGEVGTSYYFGNFTPIDTNLAIDYWRKGYDAYDHLSVAQLMGYYMENGQTDSMLLAFERGRSIGNPLCYENMGHHVADTAPSLAIQYYEAAARHGKYTADLYAAYVYANNGNMSQALACCDRVIAYHEADAYIVKADLYSRFDNEKKALKTLVEGANQGHAACNMMLANYYIDQGSPTKAEPYLLAANTPEALFTLADLYMDGRMEQVEADEEQSARRGVSLLRRASAMGNSDANNLLAAAYYSGYGVEQNPDSAFYYANRSIDDPSSLMLLGYLYEGELGFRADSATALQYFQQAGEAGNPKGYARLGYIYATGEYGQQDSAKAFRYFTLAAENADMGGFKYQEALCHLHGFGTPVDTAAAIRALRQAVGIDGDPTSAGLLGEFYDKGLGGLPCNADSAIYYFQIGSRGDDPLSDLRLGAIIYGNGDYARALPFLMSSAEHGNTEATAIYANALIEGNGIDEPLPEEGLDILTNLIRNYQQPEAYYFLGLALLETEGITPDPERALRMLDTAASLGNAWALYTLHKLYSLGRYVDADTVRALDYLQRAAAQHHANALVTLGNCYRLGHLTPIDLKRAAEYYQKAADRGNLEALCRLGLCYENGDGVILNSQRAFELYSDAAQNGSAYGMRLLAYCYIEGIYVKEDLAQAAHWFQQAAEAGDLHSIYMIGKMYATGEGVKKDKKEARKWLSIAYNHGIEEAKDYLDRL